MPGHDSGKILDQTLWLAAKGFTVVHDHQAIPTGEIALVAGTPMDFTTAKPIGRDIEADFQQMKYVGGYDHNYALREAPGERMKMAEAHSDKTGITLEAFTTCCGVQLYAGNSITPQKGKDGASYSERDGFCRKHSFTQMRQPGKFCKSDFKGRGALQLDDQLPFFCAVRERDFPGS